MKYKTGDTLIAIHDYYSKLTGNQLFTKGTTYWVRVGDDNGIAYVMTDTGRSRELTTGLVAMIFDNHADRFDYAMSII